MRATDPVTAPGTPLAVLHVDDFPADRYRRKRVLEAAGFRIIDVETGGAARSAFSTAHPDLVLIDVRLPDTDGLQLTREIKAHAAADGRDVAVVLISSYFTESEYRVRGLESGADAYLIEPITDAELIATLRAVSRRLEQVRAGRQLAEQLTHRVEELEHLLELVPVGVAISEDPQSRHMRANAALLRMLGAPRNTNVSVTAPPSERPSWRIFRDGRPLTADELPMQRAAAKGVNVENEECDLVFDDGRVVRLLVSASPLFGPDGSPRGSIGVLIDISDRKQLEDQRLQAMRDKDEFLSVLSHELRQPLTAVFSALQVMRLGAGDRPASAAEQVIERQALHLRRLVDDLLDAARIGQGKMSLRQSSIDLRDAVTNAIEIVRSQLDQRGLLLESRLPEHAARITADFDRLVQVFSNLLQNAVKYTERGGAVSVSVDALPSFWVVSVRDTGRGIAPESLPRVFDLFVQESERGGTGLGIGLALVRRLVEMHGGRVEARSAGVGRGSDFLVWLPAEERSATE